MVPDKVILESLALGYLDYGSGYYWFPLAISRISHNNGWIKIESEEDLPKNEGQYFVYSKIDYGKGFRIDIFTGRLSNTFENGKFIFTHYRPIIKPQPPIY